jgi:glycosyltransferase involved in cell wall biosynthesis
MRYIINGKFLSQRTTGVQRFAFEILKELDIIAKNLDIALAIRIDATDIPEFKNIKVEQVGTHRGIIWDELELPFYIIRCKAIGVHLCFRAPIIKPDIVCIHDINQITCPSSYSLKSRIPYFLLTMWLIRKAKRIFTVSYFSMKEINKIANRQLVYIESIIGNAWQHLSYTVSDTSILSNLALTDREYYFTLGSLCRHKNLSWIFNTATLNPTSLFVIAGSVNRKVLSAAQNQHVPTNVKLIGYVSDSEAKTLMSNCKAFIYPSYYEGFGVPPLEALGCGCKKIVVSDIEVMHEIYSNAAVYINPYEPIGDIDEYILNYPVHMQPEDVLGKYSWVKSAHTLFNVLKEYENIIVTKKHTIRG